MSDQYSYTPASPEAVKIFPVAAVQRQRYPLHALLFLLTVGTTLIAGAYLMMIHESSAAVSVDPFRFFLRVLDHPGLLYKGIAYAGTIMLVLLAHEMGHFLACQYYGINATLPFFIPAPVGVMTGTFGAFIRIKSAFPNRKALFDVGLAGPIAGFVMLLPFLYFGLKWSTQVPPGQITGETGYFGEPLIFRMFASFILKDGYDTFLHPTGFAVWFACLATSLNLLPIAQLDGGHVSYAVFGKRAHVITWIFFFGVIGLAIYGFTQSKVAGFQWLFYAGLLLILRQIAGFKHPPTLDDSEPIGLARIIWAVIALIVFALTFVPVTIFVK
jgi:membrane-associated protease RseP (regulator of RpoE activity)